MGLVGVSRWVLLGLALTTACSDEDGSAPAPEEAFCDAYCQVYWECERIPGHTCNEWCLSESTGFVHRINREALALAAACLSERPCSEVEDAQFVEICLEAVEPDVDATDVLVRFCEEMSPTWFDCGYRADVHECIESFKLWSDGVLGRAIECAVMTCEEMESCLDAAFSP